MNIHSGNLKITKDMQSLNFNDLKRKLVHLKKSLNKEVGPAFSKDVANALRTIISNNENTEVN